MDDTRLQGLPDCSWYDIPKREKHTKWPQNVPNGHKICQMTEKSFKRTYVGVIYIPTIYIPRPSKIYTQIGIFGMKKIPSHHPSFFCF
jgi:hypothetical protein